MISYKLEQIAAEPSFYKFDDFFGLTQTHVKLEGLNIAGSIKLKTATYLINGLEATGLISPENNTIIESSSGNLGIALSMVCRSKGYKFICITDPNTSQYAERYMHLYGAEIIKVTTRDAQGGFLGTRIEIIENLLRQNPNYVWTNQYSSKNNIAAHYHTTAPEILNFFQSIDYLFIGAGTTGTLVGCTKYFKEHSPQTKIIAVDTKGSVTFGFHPARRYIPGLGTSRRPEICDTTNVYKVMLVEESRAILMCNYLLQQYGLFLGGSSGSVLYAVKEFFKSEPCINPIIVALSPDFGDKYLETVYNSQWVQEKFGSKLFDETL